jgi:S-(hydroxymethyl)glutathione dehydrogenase/alcohol dehydrogenase
VKAAVYHTLGEPLLIDDVELRAMAPSEVRVKIAASGVCHSDLSILDGTMPVAPPMVLGHEGAGVVVEVGADVTRVAPGDHVIISWVTPCRRCRWCLGGQPTLCEHGMDHAFASAYATWKGTPVMAGLGTATFGEETIVPEGAVVLVERDFPLELASLIGCGVVTGVGAVVNSAAVRPGETVAVIGCGGVGLSAIQGARLSGAARIVAVDRVPAKLEMAEANGATDVVDASAGDAVAGVQRLIPGGVDHGIEVVGSAPTIEQAYAMTRRGGTVTIVGAGPGNAQASFGVLGLMYDAKTVRGCVYGSTDPARDFPRMVELARKGALDLERLVTRRITIDDVNAAFDAMKAGEVARSVIVF